jgi:membrane protein implicated in regulation of membrane protease activity
MLIFFAIAIAGFIIVGGGALFGHGDGHDIGHGADHAGDHDAVVSVFSPRVIGTFIMGFGAGGTIAVYSGTSTMAASLAGVGVGFLLGLVMYLITRMFYSEQSTTVVRIEETVGRIGIVTVPIDAGSVGKVEVQIGDLRRDFLARAADRTKSLARGQSVRVTAHLGSELTVETDSEVLRTTS